MTRILPVVLLCAACAPIPPKTPEDCRDLRTQRDVELGAAMLLVTGAAVGAVISETARDPVRGGPRTIGAGVAVGSAGLATVAIGHGWYSGQQADQFCQEIEQ